MADDDVTLTDLEVIQQFSLAVRGASASRAEVIAALEADLAFLGGGRRAPAKDAPSQKAPARVAPSQKAPAQKAPAKKSPAQRSPAKKAPAKAPAKRPVKAPAKATRARRA